MLRASAPPEAEYALFDSSEIELRSSEPGRVREHGYQTTVALARERLEALGATPQRARDAASALQPGLAAAYARGSAVRRIARYLTAVELLASETYDASVHAYRGVYLDLATLATDLGRAHASTELRALHLALVLESAHEDAKVVLTTDAWTKTRRPGERTYRRPPLAAVAGLRDALSAHADTAPEPRIEDALPRQDVLALLRTRADAATDEDERALYVSLQTAITAREQPEKGPLADPALWAIEQRLDAGQVASVVESIEALEREIGRTPGTTYLRGRASLLLHLEPPKLVAERVSALALSMTSFQELSLLAAEAWLEAGDPRRAMPYARDLVDAPGIDEGLLMRAQRVLARVVGAAPARGRAKTLADSIPAPMPPSNAPTPPTNKRASIPVSPPDPNEARTYEPAPSRVPTVRGTPPSGTARFEPPAPPPRSEPPVVPTRAEESRPAPPHAVPLRTSQRPGSAQAVVGSRPPGLDLDLAPPATSFTVDLPGSAPPEAGTGSAPPSRPSRRRMTGARIETVAPSSADPRAEPDDPPSVVPAMPAPRAPRIDSALLAAAPTPFRGTPVARHMPEPLAPPEARAELGTDLLHGASLPTYKIEVPPPVLARASALPRSPIGDELAEHLSLPPGVPEDAVPVVGRAKNVLEARVQMTLLARELGLDYRLKRGVVLRADVGGIEAMQAHLRGTFPDHAIRTAEDALEVNRHGALLAEILIRRLGAEWVDVTPAELGYWALIVPPDARVWPFGRVARLIANGHRERDLVSTYLELEARSQAAR